MTDPHASTFVVAAGSFSLIAGQLFGLPLPALIGGLIGGLIALKLDEDTPGQPRKPVWSRVATVAIGMACASVGAYPVVESSNLSLLWIAPAAIAIGATAGAGAELILRALIRGVVNRIEQFGGTNRSNKP